ncbi:MAG: L-threonylcarbamoyladenylate synthase [Candidatus Saccharimonas sp.]
MAQHFSDINDIKVAAMLNGGAVGVILTDTVYGLVAKAGSLQGIQKLYSIKHRESAPGTLIGSSVDAFQKLGFASKQLARVARYWPASLSVVLDASDVPDYLKQVRTSLPVRIPPKQPLLELLKQTGALMTTSANRHGSPTVRSIAEAESCFGDEVGFYVDGGEVMEHKSSTIIGFDDMDQMIVFRTGAYPIEELELSTSVPN